MTDLSADVQRGIHETNPSPTDRELLEQLVGHGEQEDELIARYGRLREGLQSALSRYLVTIIVEDEQRHHRVIRELAHTLAWGGLEQSEASVPSLGTAHEAPAFIELTRRLLDSERRDHRELRKLRARLRDFEDTTAWTLLVDTMVLDTKKHIRVLRFLMRHMSPDASATEVEGNE